MPSDTDDQTVCRLRRETILHREAKNILERKRRIKVPSLELTVWREPPEEFAGDWDSNRLRAFWCTVPIYFNLKEVRLEQRLGGIVPDVIAYFDKPGPTMRGMIATWIDEEFEEENEEPYSFSLSKDLLIEVTVTHGIDSTKLSKIQAICGKSNKNMKSDFLKPAQKAGFNFSYQQSFRLQIWLKLMKKADAYLIDSRQKMF